MKYVFLTYGLLMLYATSCRFEPKKKKYYMVRTFKDYQLLSLTHWEYDHVKDSFYTINDTAAYDTAMLNLHSRISTEAALRAKYGNTPGLMNQTTDVNIYDEHGRNIMYSLPLAVRDSLANKWIDYIKEHPRQY